MRDVQAALYTALIGVGVLIAVLLSNPSPTFLAGIALGVGASLLLAVTFQTIRDRLEPSPRPAHRRRSGVQ